MSLAVPLGRATAPALAQPASAESTGYRALMEQGLAEYDANHFTEARALFWQAYSLSPNARVLRCLGMVEFELRNYRDSTSWLERALSSELQPLTPELQQEAASLLARARGFIAQLQLTLHPVDAAVSIDGTPRAATQGTVQLEAGDHTLTFSAPGHITERRVLKARGGDVHSWDVILTPEPVARVAEPSSVVSAAAEPAHKRFIVVPRFTLVMPGKGSYWRECTDGLCEPGQIEPKRRYSRNASPLLGIDFLYAPVPELHVGVGVHVQLNETSWDFGGGTESGFGRAFWVPAVAEYRVRLNEAFELPIRLVVGLTMVKAGRDLKRLGETKRDGCELFAASGSNCSVVGPPAAGLIFGVGPGIAYDLGRATLRGDLMLGYQWTRLIEMEVRGGGFSDTDRHTDGTFIAALSAGVEL